MLAFAADAYINEMGISNDLFPKEELGNIGKEKASHCLPSERPEDTRDPRTGLRGIDNFQNFIRFLAPPSRGPIDEAAIRGEIVFADVGCASCHTPRLETGPSEIPAFNRQTVPLYADLLLHDIGTGDGIEQADAKGGEIRTPALWGLRFRRPLLHDGTAPTIESAIDRHAGEASRVVERFRSLHPEMRRELLAFLKSL